MNLHAIFDFFNANKEHLAMIGSSFVVIASVILKMLPVPDEASGGIYKFVWNVIHVIAINKKVPQ